MRLAWLISSTAFVLAGGCGSEGESSRDALREAIVLQPDVIIGLIEGDSAYLFGDVRSVAVDSAGRVYVGDRIGATIRVYDSSGQYLEQIAREGEGPGEIYGWPADITTAADGNVYVRDGSRITVFAPSDPGGVADSVAAIWPISGYGNLSSTRSRLAVSGAYYYPTYRFRIGEPPRYFYLPFRNGAATGDTLEVPSYASLSFRRQAMVPTDPGNARMVPGLSHVPFAPLPSWDVTHNGTILSSDATRYELIETDMAGDTLRTIRGPSNAPREIPPAERADSLRALDARLDTLPVPIDQVIGLGEGVRQRQLPAILPALLGIHVAADRSIWVEQWPPEGRGESRYYDVLDADGQFRMRVILQAPIVRDPPPFFGSRYVAGVIRDSDTGVERVVRFAIATRTDSAS